MEWFIFFVVIIGIYKGLKEFGNYELETAKDKGGKKPSGKREPYSTVRFKYRDGNGDVTERTVDVRSGKRGEKFSGYCRLRREERTFYFQRIEGFEVIDVNSGEVITPMEWRYNLQGTKTALAELEKERKNMQRLSGV